jgi:hypothetical protein
MTSREENDRAGSAQTIKRETLKRTMTDSQESESDGDFKTSSRQSKTKLHHPTKRRPVETKTSQTSIYIPKRTMFGSVKSTSRSHSSSFHGNRSAIDYNADIPISKSNSNEYSQLLLSDKAIDKGITDTGDFLKRIEEDTAKEKPKLNLKLPKRNKSSEDSSDCQADKKQSKLILPSRKKKETTSSNNSNDDDVLDLDGSEASKIMEKLERTRQMERATVFTCPFCLVDFNKTTRVIEKELDLMAQKDRDYKQWYIKEHENSSIKKPDGLIKRQVSTNEKEAFCRLHELELVIKPKGRAEGYLFDIDFKALRERIKKMQLELDDVIYKKIPSDYRNVILQDYGNVGTNKARTPMMMMNRMDSLLPGYYGPRGAAVMLDVLSDMFLKSGKLSKQLSAPQMPMEYLHQVLIPETAYRLIRQDLVRRQQRDSPRVMLSNANLKAKNIMRESRHFGEVMYPLTDDKEEEDHHISSTLTETPRKSHHNIIVLD